MKKKASAQDPLWYKDAIIYETHVKAFFDSNNDGMGEFKGLLQKLDYLQSLGITCLWLLPFYPSPLKDDGYDISYYTDVHPSYGTIEDFREFLQAAHERGIQVLTELVINHTSDQHPWFQRARKAPPGSPERDYYVWSDTGQEYQEARIIFTDTETSNWAWDAEAKAYYWHRFFSHQPDLNYANPEVLREIIQIMRFWLDMGVDAMRLDAIPYLCEREATNCENLPETHAVLKEIRRQLDAEYESRVFLAEANQWPADVRAYFGDGDECHMAYNFPVMPRIFMALHMEDRHPITEILGQTPAIPEICQWALFLRNHDELTLEMVTDEERDYMYNAYSQDPQMRLNVGIRRRLAPLMENNRRRIELLNSLLFSFPGTPIIYYGDEIGMGDNIYLGDRNGVRTPMQWSGDRNAGFSRATPGKLCHPVIMDPVYGYEAINVEAQQNDPSSLLNWMKYMIALRRQFTVFGRGTLEVLHPKNRKVLAYVRRYQDDIILCVANLSRFAQPAELDLSAFAGLTPVEMMGFTNFPPIGDLPYFITLGPYSFYWFNLQELPSEIAVQKVPEPVEELGEVPALVVEGDWRRMFEGDALDFLERQVLPAFLQRQRWFGGKARGIKNTSVLEWTRLIESPLTFLTLVGVEYGEGDVETYSLPLSVASGPGAEQLQETHPECVLGRIENSAESGLLHDALFDDGTCWALLQAIEEKQEFSTQHGVIRGIPAAMYHELRGTAKEPLPVARGGAEQSNTSVRYGDRLILKLYRRLETGPNPDYEVSRYLSEQAGFTRVPPLAGGIEYQRPETESTTLAMLQQLVANQGDGWKSTLEDLDRYFERTSAKPDIPEDLPTDGRSLLELFDAAIPETARDALGVYLERAGVLGKRTAEMHLALARPTDDPAFAPEPMTAADGAALKEAMSALGEKALDLLKQNLTRLPKELMKPAKYLLGQRRRLLARFDKLAENELSMVKTRIHGDYHLAQVLCVENDFVILDFEGEPARPLAERRTKQSPLKDTAGMLRSFGYAAHAGFLAFSKRRPTDFQRVEPWADLWEVWAAAAFLRQYRETAAGAPFLPRDSEQLEALLHAFILDKALYELLYELNNRPDWVRIPLQAIIRLLAG